MRNKIFLFASIFVSVVALFGCLRVTLDIHRYNGDEPFAMFFFFVIYLSGGIYSSIIHVIKVINEYPSEPDAQKFEYDPCPNCGSRSGKYSFSRVLPMSYHCDDCGGELNIPPWVPEDSE